MRSKPPHFTRNFHGKYRKCDKQDHKALEWQVIPQRVDMLKFNCFRYGCKGYYTCDCLSNRHVTNTNKSNTQQATQQWGITRRNDTARPTQTQAAVFVGMAYPYWNPPQEFLGIMQMLSDHLEEQAHLFQYVGLFENVRRNYSADWCVDDFLTLATMRPFTQAFAANTCLLDSLA